MKLFIPPLKTRLRLVEPWTFTLYDEYRSDDLWETLGLVEELRRRRDERNNKLRNDRYIVRDHNWYDITHPVTLPADSILKVDRIYIRNGGEEYDSVTFRTESIPGIKGKPRFWAKLHDVNQMEVEVLPQ